MKKNLLQQSIVYLEADRNYTVIYYHDSHKDMFSLTLKRFAELLADDAAFVRIHRSYLVNRQYIAEVTPDNVVMRSGVVLPLARRRRV